MDKAFIHIQMEQDMKDSGKTINKRVKEKKNGRMALSMKEIIYKGRRKERGCCNLLMGLRMKDSFLKMKYLGRGTINGRMGNPIKVI